MGGGGGASWKSAPGKGRGQTLITANVAGVPDSPTISGTPNEIIGAYIASMDDVDVNTQTADDSGIMSAADPYPEFKENVGVVEQLQNRLPRCPRTPC